MIDGVIKTLIDDNSELEIVEDEVQEDVEALDTVGLNCELIDDVKVDDGDVIYTFAYPDEITDEISVDTINNDVVLNITEGTVHNEFRICEDGSMYLDGEKLQIKNSEVSERTIDEVDLPDFEGNLRQSSGEVTNWLTTTCPYGKKANYTYKLGTAKDPDITFTTAVSNITFSAFMLAMSAALGINPALSTGLSYVFSYIRDRNPSTRGLSYKATNYAHKNYHNTYIKPIGKYAFRSDYKWYPEKKYKGTAYSKTYYRMKQIG